MKAGQMSVCGNVLMARMPGRDAAERLGQRGLCRLWSCVCRGFFLSLLLSLQHSLVSSVRSAIFDGLEGGKLAATTHSMP